MRRAIIEKRKRISYPFLLFNWLYFLSDAFEGENAKCSKLMPLLFLLRTHKRHNRA